MSLKTEAQQSAEPAFNPLKVIIPVLLSLLAVSLMAQWYAANVSVPRYCQDPQQALLNLHKLLDQNSTIEPAQRRASMIAAKLLYLHPRTEDESQTDYLQRLRYLLLNQCSEQLAS